MPSIKHVAITGGTHGNELTGVYLLKHWRNNPVQVCRDSFATELHLANPKAHGHNRRYLDQDLNRQFNWPDLNDHALCGYEQNRAKSLNTLLGPKDEPRVDFVLDLHTTTANMGVTLVVKSDDPLVTGMAFYVKQRLPEVTLFHEPSERMDDNFLISLGRRHGLLIEVGPVPQGLLRWDIYHQTETVVGHCLDYLEAVNRGEALELPAEMPGFRFVQKVQLPENERGELIAMVHPNLQDADYQPIAPGDALFMTLDGQTLPYEGEETLYGAFINEAAYYDRHVGLSLMRPCTIKRSV
ncbi:aspartoacylase [Saccharospirillum mangrovi]|uniref:aspartoacylase n=1 Tax=Saccharospirillum mangrovi TaxID=2161747 RepID=UPI000D3B3F0F|nr:aspartoacylase [Saccharospirillum mangrovi]